MFFALLNQLKRGNTCNHPFRTTWSLYSILPASRYQFWFMILRGFSQLTLSEGLTSCLSNYNWLLTNCVQKLMLSSSSCRLLPGKCHDDDGRTASTLPGHRCISRAASRQMWNLNINKLSALDSIVVEVIALKHSGAREQISSIRSVSKWTLHMLTHKIDSTKLLC